MGVQTKIQSPALERFNQPTEQKLLSFFDSKILFQNTFNLQFRNEKRNFVFRLLLPTNCYLGSNILNRFRRLTLKSDVAALQLFVKSLQND